MGKNDNITYVLKEKTEFVLSFEMKCPKSEFLNLKTNYIVLGESGKAILNATLLSTM